MNAIAAIAALSVAALTLLALLRANLGARLVADPSGERWHERATPVFGGVGIFAGLLAGVGAAVVVGATDMSSELAGILAGCAILFAAGLADDVYTLPPLAKLAAQFAAAGVVLASGLTVEIIANDVLATALGLVWLVGITNAFNLLDNMDGLAASLAAVSCAIFAVDAVAQDSGELGLVVALALGGACLGFLPFNLRPGRRAVVFMGDSGSQVIGFGLASLALASSWTTAGATLTSMLLPLLVLAIPILDTTLVAVRRTLERRPLTQGGTDHSSHRLVYYGLSERQAVALLTLVAALLGATALAYNVLADARVTAVGVLISFVVLVQFASFLGDLEQRSRSHETGPAPSLWRAFFSNPRRLLEVLVDFAVICTSFLAAYLLQVDGGGTNVQRAIFLSTLPVLLAGRYVLFVVFGIYRRVWRFASWPRPRRDRRGCACCPCRSGSRDRGCDSIARDVSARDLPVDALLCTSSSPASRLALRTLAARPRRGDGAHANARPDRRRRPVRPCARARAGGDARRRVVGFLDDNPAVRRRRVLGVKVLGTLADASTQLDAAQPDQVFVTIPNVPAERLRELVAAARTRGSRCRIVRRIDASEHAPARRGTERVSSSERRRLPEPRTLLPLFAAYALLAALYAWQAWQRETPTLFSDEIEFTQVSRAIASTGEATVREGFGQPATSVSLYAYLAAPAWWLSDVSDAYGLIKLLGVALMTSTIFPAYALARVVVSRPYAFLRRGRSRRGTCAVVLTVPGRRAGRLSGGDARVPADRARRGDTDALADRAGAPLVRPRRARPDAAGGAVPDPCTRAAGSALALGAACAAGAGLGRLRTGSASQCS